MTEVDISESAMEEQEGGIGEEVTEEGRYIPYSGGLMGWFENSGVLKCELGNNYLFHTVMASDSVRAKQFERWGDAFNRRTGRKRYRKETGVTLVLGKNEIHGSTRDISSHGVRLQFLEDVGIQKNDSCNVRLHDGDSDQVLVEVSAKVVWMEKIGRIRPVWNLGLSFGSMTQEQSDAIKPLLVDED